MSKFVPIELDRMRNLRYGMKALITIEEKTNRKISQIISEDMSIKDLATTIYAGLVHEDKSLTIDKVIDLIDEYSDITEVSEKMAKAMEEAYGKNAQRAAHPAMK